MPANLTLGVCFSSELLPLLPLLPPLCYITTTTSLPTHTAHNTYFLSKYPRMPTRTLGQAYSCMKRPSTCIVSYLYCCLHHCKKTACWSATTLYPLSLHSHSYHNTHTHRTTIYLQYYVDSMWTTRASLPLDIVSTISPGPPTCTHTTSDLLFRLMGSYIQLPKTQNTNTH